jgi:multiple sugar transport system permease protein
MRYFSNLFGNTKRTIKFLALTSFIISLIGALLPLIFLLMTLISDKNICLNLITEVLEDKRFISSLENSFFLSLLPATLITILSCIAALFFRKIDLTGNKWLYGLAIIPAFIPDQVFGIAGRMILDPTIGLLSEQVAKNLLVGRFYSLLLVTFFLLIKWLPLMIVLCDSMIAAIPSDLYFSSKMDFKSFFLQTRYTYIPHLKEVLVLIFAIMFLIGFRQHELAFELTSSSGGFVSESWSLWNYKQIFSFNQQSKAVIEAISVLILLMIPVLTIKTMAQKLSDKE